MWLDCILLFPLIMLGLERLVHEKKGILYCVSLGVSILSNYYISIMICLFMVGKYGSPWQPASVWPSGAQSDPNRNCQWDWNTWEHTRFP